MIINKTNHNHPNEVSAHSTPAALLHFWLRRPLSVTGCLAALGLILVPVYQLAMGKTYFVQLNYIDQTTLIMLGLLLLRMVYVFRSDSDLQAVSLALVSLLTFIYTFEAIYKWAFYIRPWLMSPAELRELVTQIGIALTGLVGVAFGRFRWTSLSKTFTIIFWIGWIFWILVGYPQIFDGNFHRPVILDLPLSHSLVYLLNRGVKFSLFLAIFFAAQTPNKPDPAAQ